MKWFKLMSTALTVLATATLSSAFLFQDSCPAATPCTCSGDATHLFLNCNNKNLTSVPVFHNSQPDSKLVIVMLNENKLTTVPNNAFKNLQTLNAATVQIQLDENMLTDIEMYSFYGIESTVTILQLQNNRLASIPAAVGRLSSLEYLDVTNNPLKTIGSSVMSGIGQSLKTFYINLQTFPSWPSELSYLQRLEHLTIINIPYASVNSNIFRGFEQSLLSLTVQQAPALKKVPSAVCQLSKLNLLSLEHFDGLTTEGGTLFENCTKQGGALTSFELEVSNLTTFPDVFNMFPTVQSLNLYGNSLDIIEAESISSGNTVTKIDLDSNKFSRIPSALNKMKNLEVVDLTNNVIISVEDVDLTGLFQLQSLLLANNPLRYISSHAFDNNKRLTTLDLGNTALKTIPVAVTSLAQLVDFDIRGGHIACTCDLSYLRGWNVRPVLSFDGRCSNTNVDIRTFIMNSLQRCPQ